MSFSIYQDTFIFNSKSFLALPIRMGSNGWVQCGAGLFVKNKNAAHKSCAQCPAGTLSSDWTKMNIMNIRYNKCREAVLSERQWLEYEAVGRPAAALAHTSQRRRMYLLDLVTMTSYIKKPLEILYRALISFSEQYNITPSAILYGACVRNSQCNHSRWCYGNVDQNYALYPCAKHTRSSAFVFNYQWSIN